MSGEASVLSTAIEIGSDARISGSNSVSDFKVRFHPPVRCKTIIPQSVVLPFGWCAVDGENNKVYFDNGGVQKIATLTKKTYYNGADLATDLTTAMNAADGTISATCTYNTSTNTMTIASTSAIKLLWATAKTAGYFSYKLFGFAATDETVAATTRTGPYGMRLEKYSHVYVRSSVLCQGMMNPPYSTRVSDNDTTVDSGYNVFLKLPVIGMPFDTLVYNKDYLPDPFEYTNMKTLELVDIQLYSPYGNIIDLNGYDWSINLLVR